MATISNNDIAKAIYLSSQNKTGNELETYLQNVVQFLVKKRLLSKKDVILTKLKNIIDIENGVVDAKIATASKLSPETKHNIAHILKKRCTAKDVVLNEVIDKKIIGGLRIEAKDEVIDMTIKNKLRKLQEHLSSI